jgi:hypothetical protein
MCVAQGKLNADCSASGRPGFSSTLGQLRFFLAFLSYSKPQLLSYGMAPQLMIEKGSWQLREGFPVINYVINVDNWGSGGIAPPSWPWHEIEVSSQLHASAANPQYALDRRLGGPHQTFWCSENSWPSRDPNSDPSVNRPVATRYTDCATAEFISFKDSGHGVFSMNIYLPEELINRLMIVPEGKLLY